MYVIYIYILDLYIYIHIVWCICSLDQKVLAAFVYRISLVALHMIRP